MWQSIATSIDGFDLLYLCDQRSFFLELALLVRELVSCLQLYQSTMYLRGGGVGKYKLRQFISVEKTQYIVKQHFELNWYVRQPVDCSFLLLISQDMIVKQLWGTVLHMGLCKPILGCFSIVVLHVCYTTLTSSFFL